MNTSSPAEPSAKPPQDGRTRRARRGAPAELTTDAFLDLQRVSELQEMWEFWQGGHKAPPKKQDLLDDLRRALADESVVGQRIKLLSDRPREVLVRIVRSEGFRAALPELVAAGGNPLEAYEVEASARALARRGFVRVEHETNGHGHREVYVLPRDLGETIAALLLEERRGPKDVFSLAGFLASLPPLARGDLLDRLAVPPGAETSIESATVAVLAAIGPDPLALLTDGHLRTAVHETALRMGGVAPRGVFDGFLPAGAPSYGKRLRGLLEASGVGTVTSLDLREYGLDLGGETVVLFPEITDRVLDAAPPVAETFDRTSAARVDLLTDLQQFLDLVAVTPLRVTQGRSIYRAAQHRVLDVLVLADEAIFPKDATFALVYELAFSLELLAVDEDSRLKLTKKGETWHAVDLTEKVRAIYARFLEERLVDGRDFHARRLRRALAASLAAAANPAEGSAEGSPGRWLPIDEAPMRVRNGYLAALDEQGVREQYKNRFRYVFTPPKQSPAEATLALREYALTRLWPLGLVEVAITANEPVAIRMTDMGRRLVAGEPLVEPDAAHGGKERAGEPARPLVVNPDFEVILFPDGGVHDIAHRLDRFAARTKSDEVAHYRISRDGIERAVVKGMTADEILEFLELYGRTPVPQNVAYSIREWVTRVAFLRQREVVLLIASSEDALTQALSIDDVARLLVERIAPKAAALRGRVTEWKTLEALRTLGIYFRE